MSTTGHDAAVADIVEDLTFLRKHDMRGFIAVVCAVRAVKNKDAANLRAAAAEIGEEAIAEKIIARWEGKAV